MLSNKMTSTPKTTPQSDIACNVNSKAVVNPVRNKIMQSVGRTNTHPEMVVRWLVHSLGYLFRLDPKVLRRLAESGFVGIRKTFP